MKDEGRAGKVLVVGGGCGGGKAAPWAENT
jgi:hypothetical protein